ncbi:hypothetical protein E2562_007843 [Oryza meyeriana var. granulata]|uniref:Uncharacterized protein n=1 Tax=Oryza meyeriana var. granulata TaxID=110450 RepID=A0A6G1F546_9ORYZ|nr:hypothetical protein E2562_007843 [Oryza meyeriana var. granulata]
MVAFQTKTGVSNDVSTSIQSMGNLAPRSIVDIKLMAQWELQAEWIGLMFGEHFDSVEQLKFTSDELVQVVATKSITIGYMYKGVLWIIWC